MNLRFSIQLWITALLMALITTVGCKELDITPGLPEPTQEGKNTFGCMVDGALWLPYVEHTLDSKVEGEYAPGWFGVRAERELDPLQYIWLQVADSTAGPRVKTYTVKDGFYARFETYKDGAFDIYETDSLGGGHINITKVETKTGTAIGGVSRTYTIVSGTFSFAATSINTGKVVTITDGRFDVQGF